LEEHRSPGAIEMRAAFDKLSPNGWRTSVRTEPVEGLSPNGSRISVRP